MGYPPHASAATPLERRPGEAWEAAEAVREAGRYYFELILERRARPRDDMISPLIAAEVDRGDKRIPP
ncbi:hypothetical protein [Nocardia sienata]|uniref:hypothetical protein n=1 Tax=Nocardia sienata TaxID=248552 RepID=UPI0007A3DB36|nr:hypothetical protein [Nocardia sienata]